MSTSGSRIAKARRNGATGGRRPAHEAGHERGGGPGRGAWFAPIPAVTIIVILAWAAAIFQSTPEVFVAASLVFSICEGIVLAFVGCVWSSRGPAIAAVVAAITGILATPGRWEVAYLRTGQTLQMNDLLLDLGVTVAWGAFAGLAGSTILRERLSKLLPGRV